MEKLSVDLQLQPPHMTNTSEPTPSKKLGRGKAWKDDESVNLARSVGMTGFDSIHGADQKAAPYWSKIYVAFVELSGSTDRTEKAIRNQWGKIQAQINLFIGVHATIVAVERSGWVPDDYINASLDLYKRMH
ncbi:hypothetical protein H257_11495 [Aphanomyces astaci]|uniref:Myb/SANT-like domain-containing protein n=1 Tax=Aphanomyces astaci TaxID=112090 RepID=W4G455_APHAT|nr:hypothetical protein H257_11495 [Aphanomyces astaci]ETV73824.1 hypothetical protein H257_11495 [Aphanomyces astaci]|eukprot:XP_009836760.1 hypothetical protein H257_11495 [Aphanomyces astaci]